MVHLVHSTEKSSHKYYAKVNISPSAEVVAGGQGITVAFLQSHDDCGINPIKFDP